MNLTPRQWEIARLVHQGQPNKVIARQLGIAEATVKVQLKSIYQKLQINKRAVLAVRVNQWLRDNQQRLNEAAE